MNGLEWAGISRRIKELRNKNKLTIERLSEIIGVSTSFIGLVERGDSGISLENIYKLSCIFGVSVDYLLTGESAENLKPAPSKFSRLNAALSDYTESELDFLVDLAGFIRGRAIVK